MFRYLFFSTCLLMAGSTVAYSENENVFDTSIQLVIEDVDGRELKSFTIKQLSTEFPQHVYETRTPWTGAQMKAVHRGPLLEDVLDKSGFPPKSAVKVIAYDDFVSVMPLEIVKAHKPMLAVEALKPGEQCLQADCEGETRFRPIKVTDKGPVMFVWPYERFAEALLGEHYRFWVFSPVTFRAEY